MTQVSHYVRIFSVALFALALTGCSSVELASHYAKKWGGGPGQKTAGVSKGAYKVGNPYKVGSVWYYPEESFTLRETGIASWYGPDFHGRKTANGEIYNQYDMTAAHRTLQMPSFVRVTNLENGRSVILRVNDRGPYKHGRVIDVSRKGAELLGFVNKGTARVKVEVLEKESRKVAALAQQGHDTSRMTVADVSRAPQQVAVSSPRPQITRGPQYASLKTEALPESLQTPKITVEELSAPPGKAAAQEWNAPLTSYQQRQGGTQAVAPQPLARPKPVISQAPVSAAPKTALYVQAGAFSVQGNASRLKDKLSSIGPAFIEPVDVKGRKLYRVRLGPYQSVAAADMALESVIRSGQAGARVMR